MNKGVRQGYPYLYDICHNDLETILLQVDGHWPSLTKSKICASLYANDEVLLSCIRLGLKHLLEHQLSIAKIMNYKLTTLKLKFCLWKLFAYKQSIPLDPLNEAMKQLEQLKGSAWLFGCFHIILCVHLWMQGNTSLRRISTRRTRKCHCSDYPNRRAFCALKRFSRKSLSCAHHLIPGECLHGCWLWHAQKSSGGPPGKGAKPS